MADRTPFLKLYGDDWSHGTRALTLEQKGFFLEVLLLMWDRKAGLPCDPAWLSSALQIDPRMARRLTCDLIRLGKLEDVDGTLVNRRMEKDIATHELRSKSRRSPADLPENSGEVLDDLPEKKSETPEKSTTEAATQETPIFHIPESRVQKEKKDPPIPPRGGPTPMDALRAFEAYNRIALACGLPQAAKLTPDRQRKIIARLRDYGLDGWERALANVERSSFLTGGSDRGWRADLEFLLQAKSFAKVHDGAFGNGRHTAPAAPKQPVRTFDPYAPEYQAHLEKVFAEQNQ